MGIEQGQKFNKKEFEGLEQTNWWIVTGGPSCGKSTLLDNLARRGYRTMSEAARGYIDAQIAEGRTLEEIRRDETEFQTVVLRMKEQREDRIPTGELVIWDRGLHGDSTAYWLPQVRTELQIDPDDLFGEEIVTVLKRRYKGVFLLDRLPTYQRDYSRVEDEIDATNIHKRIDFMYKLLGYEPIRVPVMDPCDRAQFVIDQMRRLDPSVPNLPHFCLL